MQFKPWTSERVDEVIHLWNKEIGDDFPLRKELFIQNSLEDPNVLEDTSVVVTNQDDQVIAFMLTKVFKEEITVAMRRDIGWIQVLLVDTTYRNEGIGTQLLKHAEEKFQELGVTEIKIGSDPWHYFPGIPNHYEDTKQWIEARGYTNMGNEYDLLCQYDPKVQSNMPVLEDVTFSLLKETEKDEFLAFLQRCFPGRWEYEAIHYFQKGGTGREFVVLKSAGKIIGFCRVNDQQSPFIAQNVYWSPLFREPLGGIGPLGVDPSERNKGYGLAIVEAGIAILRERNIQTIVIDWTGLVRFYAKLGYSVWKAYSKYSKKLGE